MDLTITINEETATLLRTRADQQSTSLEALIAELVEREASSTMGLRMRNGVPLLPRRHDGTAITPELVNALRDEEA